MQIGIIGQGYVGLPLAKTLVSAGFAVHGIDFNQVVVEELKKGKSHIEDISDSEISNMVNSGFYFPTVDYSSLASCKVVIICVPTPLGDDHLPDLTYLDSAVDSMVGHIQKGVLIILESTSFPGTTNDRVFKKVSSSLNWNEKDFYCAFSPERVDPLNRNWTLQNTPKLVSGINKESRERAIQFYESFIENVIKVNKTEIAEFAKLIENSYRLINISFVNELSKLARKMGVDITETLDAAATKPYGFQRFEPGLGAGGHCIPVDPVYLLKYAESLGLELPILNEAILLNNEMPKYHARQILNLINHSQTVKAKILLIGLSYKPGVADLRESQAVSLLKELEQFGIDTYWQDPLVSKVEIGKKHKNSNVYDVVILNHSWTSKDDYLIQPDGIFYEVS